MKLAATNMFFSSISFSFVFSFLTCVQAWNVAQIRKIPFISNRQQGKQRIYKFKEDPTADVEEVKRRPLFIHQIPFKRKKLQRDWTSSDEMDLQEYWRSKEALDAQNGKRRKLGIFRTKSIASQTKYAPYPVPISTRTMLRRNRKKARRKLKIKRGLEKRETVVVTNAHELRNAVFDQGFQLKDILFQNVSFVPSMNATVTKSSSVSTNQLSSTFLSPSPKKKKKGTTVEKKIKKDLVNPLDHEVIKLIAKRVETNSKPGERSPDDTATLALSIEGGGMRGAVSAGMASAIAVLGLSDTFDSIYGSSAGSVVGAYMVSRQMCIDVYTDVLPTAKTRFVSKGRLASSLVTNIFDNRVLKNTTVLSKFVNPAMNISFVLDNIMSPEKGLRPLDVETFRINDERQQLRVVTSTVRDGKMETHCLGSRTMDFFDKVHNETGEVLERATTMVDKDRHGMFACLETSMLVPAATGPPMTLLRHKDAHLNITTKCFDAFCYEPIPYRSAVAEGATHVLVLKTRPEGNPIGTKPGLFEKVFAPIYFDTNGMPEVAEYFENGGQQYIYTEDYLTLDEGRSHIVVEEDESTKDGILVPPQKILYGVERDEEAEKLANNRNEWNRAHLFPLSVPEGKPELSVLSVDRDEVLEGVRLGFASAFDLLAPVADVELNEHLDGERVAELLFSNVGSAVNVLEDPVLVAGDFILKNEENRGRKFATGSQSPTNMEEAIERELRSQYYMYESNEATQKENINGKIRPCPRQDASELLDSLPGFYMGKMESLSGGLRQLKRDSQEA